MELEDKKTERAVAKAESKTLPAPAATRAGDLLKSLRTMDYDEGRSAVSPSPDPSVPVTRPGDAIEQDASRRAEQTGPLSPGALGGATLHTDSHANQVTTAMGAKALTRGSDIFLRGDVSPGSPEGGAILAHEVAHTEQPGAEDRVAAWWDDGHQAITRNVGLQMPEVIGPEAADYVARKSGSIDRTWQSMVTNFMQYLGVAGKMKEEFLGEMKDLEAQDFEKKQMEALGLNTGQAPTPKVEAPAKKGDKKGKDAPNEQATLEQVQKRWDRLDFHVRLPNEMPLHGEAGGYVSEGGVGRNKAAVNELVDQAAKAYNAASGWTIGNYREGLNRLADAAHANEDRGSHGEGKPFTGHDPRLLMPKQPNGQPNPHYSPGWDCDDPSKNAGGRALAEGYAREVFVQFASKLTPEKQTLLKEGKGGGESYRGGFRQTIKVVGSKKAKKLEDRQSVVLDNEHYEEIKKKHPAPAKLTPDAVTNMAHLVSDGGLALDVLDRLKTLRDEVSAGNVRDPENTFQKYTRLADAAKALAFHAERSPKPEVQKVAVEAKHIAELAATWAAQAKKWSAGAFKTKTKEERAEWASKIVEGCASNITLLTALSQTAWPTLGSRLGGGAPTPKPDTGGAPEVPKVDEKPKTESKTEARTKPRRPPPPLPKVPETEEQKKKRVIAERREQVRLESILVLRELKAEVHGPAMIEKKYGHYTRLKKCVADWNEVVGLDKSLKNEYFFTVATLGKIDRWIQRSKGYRHGDNFKEDVIADVEWILDGVARFQR